jgi:hypothetical protein
MMPPYYLDLDFDPVAPCEELPAQKPCSSAENDAWILRELARRWKPGEDRGSPLPVEVAFEL